MWCKKGSSTNISYKTSFEAICVRQNLLLINKMWVMPIWCWKIITVFVKRMQKNSQMLSIDYWKKKKIMNLVSRSWGGGGRLQISPPSDVKNIANFAKQIQRNNRKFCQLVIWKKKKSQFGFKVAKKKITKFINLSLNKNCKFHWWIWRKNTHKFHQWVMKNNYSEKKSQMLPITQGKTHEFCQLFIERK